MKYLKEHLSYSYNWPHGGDPLFTGVPSRRMFDRDNGFQVLFIINCFYESIGVTTPQAGNKIEKLINMQLPLEVKSELSVFNWLKGIYLYHSE
jgi:hypothetical protein